MSVHHPANSLWLEHKVFVGPFARSFPNVQVFVAPNRWSFPLNLPLSWLGFPGRRTQVLCADAPLASEFDYAVLDINLGRGRSGSGILPQALTHTTRDRLLQLPCQKTRQRSTLEPYPYCFTQGTMRSRSSRQPGKPPQGMAAHLAVCLYLRPSAGNDRT